MFIFFFSSRMAPRKGKTQQQEQVVLGPQVKEGENVFGVAHIFASFNDTFVHVTDLSGKWVYILSTCSFLPCKKQPTTVAYIE